MTRIEKRGKVMSTNENNSEHLMTTEEVAEFLRIRPRTVYQYVYQGIIPYKKLRNGLRFNREEILFWLEQGNFSPGLNKSKRRYAPREIK